MGEQSSEYARQEPMLPEAASAFFNAVPSWYLDGTAGSIGYEHWRGVLVTIERIKTTAYAQGRAAALREAVEAIKQSPGPNVRVYGEHGTVWAHATTHAARVVAALDGDAS